MFLHLNWNNFFAATNHCCCLESIRQVRKFLKKVETLQENTLLAIAFKHDFVALVKPMSYR